MNKSITKPNEQYLLLSALYTNLTINIYMFELFNGVINKRFFAMRIDAKNVTAILNNVLS